MEPMVFSIHKQSFFSMVKIIRQLFLFLFLIGIHGCVSIPLNRLTYFENSEYQGKPLINGCYYYLAPRVIWATGDTLDGYYIYFMVFYKNGLLKYATMGMNEDSSLVCDQVYDALIKYKDRRHIWGTYKCVNDTLFTRQIRSVGMLDYDIVETKSLLLNDSIIWRFEEKYEIPLRTFKVDEKYRFLKFDQIPDSTGYLWHRYYKRLKRNMN